MPTENEIKFVLNKESEPHFAEMSDKKYAIRQGYVIVANGVSCRVRESVQEGKRTEHYFTFKMNGGGRVVEIEKRIDERDFRDCWAKAMNKLEKVRYKYEDRHGQVWDFDFFKWHTIGTYFALAELEMPEGQLEPVSIPVDIREHILYKVPYGDNRFSSKMLADVRFATDLYQEITLTK